MAAHGAHGQIRSFSSSARQGARAAGACGERRGSPRSNRRRRGASRRRPSARISSNISRLGRGLGMGGVNCGPRPNTPRCLDQSVGSSCQWRSRHHHHGHQPQHQRKVSLKTPLRGPTARCRSRRPRRAGRPPGAARTSTGPPRRRSGPSSAGPPSGRPDTSALRRDQERPDHQQTDGGCGGEVMQGTSDRQPPPDHGTRVEDRRGDRRQRARDGQDDAATPTASAAAAIPSPIVRPVDAAAGPVRSGAGAVAGVLGGARRSV